MMGFLKNIAINLRATGPAAVLITWIIGITLLGIYGKGNLAKQSISALSITGGVLIVVLGHRT